MSAIYCFSVIYILFIYCPSFSHGVLENVVRRKVGFLKADVQKLKHKWIEKAKLLNNYNSYTNCLTCWNTSVEETSRRHITADTSRRHIETKYYTNILEKLEQNAKIELRIYRGIINKLLEIFPQNILLLDQPDTSFQYYAEDMKDALTDALSPLSGLSGDDFSFNPSPIECPYVADESKWTLIARVESCPPYDTCYIGNFILHPNGNIITLVNNNVEIFLQSGRRLKRFTIILPGYIEEISYWKDNKILVLVIEGDTGEIHVIDLETETVVRFRSLYPYETSSGLSVFGDVIVTCSGNGVLSVLLPWSPVSRIERYRVYNLYNYKQHVYRSEFGSEYGLFSGRFYHRRYVLLKATGETVCSVHIPGYSVNIARAVVSKNGMFVVALYDLPGFQAYDKECNPLGEVVPLDSAYYIRDLNIINNTLVISTGRRYAGGYGMLFMYRFEQ